VPLIIIGRNDHLAWGFTTAQADTQDLFVETLLDDTHYETPQGPAPLLRREELLRVRGSSAVKLIVEETRHGPLIEIDPATHRAYALAWTGLRGEDRTASGILAMNRAPNAAQFREALRQFESPVQNVVFADDSGNIGYVMAGRIPIRAHLEDASEMPVPGDRADFDWIGAIPFDELPQAMNPIQGYLASANNRTFGPGYAHFIAGKFDANYRIDRINEMIEATSHPSLDDMARMQMDVVSLAARKLAPLLLVRRPDPALAGWNGRMDRNRPEPLIFDAWLRELAHVLLDGRLSEVFGDFWFWDAALIEEALRGGPAAALCDDRSTPQVEDCTIAVQRAHDRAIARLTEALGPDRSAWRWGHLHRAHFPNPLLSRIPVIGYLLDPRVETDGDNFTVNRASPRVEDSTGARFDDIHGASLRVVFDLAQLDRSLFAVAGGQSGNPVSGHYADFIPLWRDGRYITMVGAETDRLRLLPESAP
jgi:penicillin G amidase